MISHQLRPSNQPITKNHHLQTQFEGLTIKSDPQVGRQTLNKFDYPLFLSPFLADTSSGRKKLITNHLSEVQLRTKKRRKEKVS